MLAALLIVFREVFEAVILVGIVMTVSTGIASFLPRPGARGAHQVSPLIRSQMKAVGFANLNRYNAPAAHPR